jgi:Nucleotidyl transferase AbiEii toxin, Type IV TA system
MPLDVLHREVAAIALHAAARHGFALAGGCALIAHGVIGRPTQDVDLFTDDEDGVQAAAAAVETSLRPRASRPGARTRAPAWLTFSRGWAKGWPSGSSPRPAAGR